MFTQRLVLINRAPCQNHLKWHWYHLANNQVMFHLSYKDEFTKNQPDSQIAQDCATFSSTKTPLTPPLMNTHTALIQIILATYLFLGVVKSQQLPKSPQALIATSTLCQRRHCYFSQRLRIPPLLLSPWALWQYQHLLVSVIYPITFILLTGSSSATD